MHRGKLGKWLAIRMGTDLHEMDKGIIPNQARWGRATQSCIGRTRTRGFGGFGSSASCIHRADTLARLEQTQRGSGERPVSGPRAEFWKLRGLRGNKKSEKNVRRSRDDLLQLTIQGKFPAYERVLLREGGRLKLV